MSDEESARETKAPPTIPKPFSKERFIIARQMLKHALQAIKKGPQADSAEEALQAEFLSLGASEENLRFIHAFLYAWREESSNVDSYFSMDRYLVGGAGILDLVLLPLLSSVGTSDVAVHIAWLAFVLSIPCVAGYLFISFVRHANKITIYWNVHGTMGTLGLLFTLGALAAFLWHIWFIASLTFLGSTLVIVTISLFYWKIVGMSKYFDRNRAAGDQLQQSTEQTALPSSEVMAEESSQNHASS